VALSVYDADHYSTIHTRSGTVHHLHYRTWQSNVVQACRSLPSIHHRRFHHCTPCTGRNLPRDVPGTHTHSSHGSPIAVYNKIRQKKQKRTVKLPLPDVIILLKFYFPGVPNTQNTPSYELDNMKDAIT